MSWDLYTGYICVLRVLAPILKYKQHIFEIYEKGSSTLLIFYNVYIDLMVLFALLM
jgi:hypothetical protein